MSILLYLLAAAPVDDMPLNKALQNLAASQSFRFVVNDGGATPSVEGRFERGKPVQLTAERIDFFRDGQKLIYYRDGAWHKPRTGTKSDPLIVMAATTKAQGCPSPIDEVIKVGKLMTNLKRTETDGPPIYSGELTAAAAKELAPPSDRDLAQGGLADVYLDAEGRLTKYRIDIVIRGRRGNADVDGRVTKTVTLTDFGRAKVEVPPAAKKALE